MLTESNSQLHKREKQLKASSANIKLHSSYFAAEAGGHT